jgi:hypothetical protein
VRQQEVSLKMLHASDRIRRNVSWIQKWTFCQLQLIIETPELFRDVQTKIESVTIP